MKDAVDLAGKLLAAGALPQQAYDDALHGAVGATSSMFSDPIIEEIHEIRRQIAAEHGNDMQRIGAYFIESKNANF